MQILTKFALSAPSSTYLVSPSQKSLLELSEQRLLGNSDSVFKVSKGQMGRDYCGLVASSKKPGQGQVFNGVVTVSLFWQSTNIVSVSFAKKQPADASTKGMVQSVNYLQDDCHRVFVETIHQLKDHFTRITFASKSRLQHFDIEL